MKKPGITGAASKRLQGPVGAQTASYLFTRIDGHHFDAQILCKTPISESAACGVSLQNCSCTSKNLDAKPPASGHRCGGQSLLDFMRWKQLESDGSLVSDCKIHQIPGSSHLHMSSSCLQPNGQNSAVFIIPARQAAGCMSLKLETPRLRKLAADIDPFISSGWGLCQPGCSSVANLQKDYRFSISQKTGLLRFKKRRQQLFKSQHGGGIK